MASTTRTSFVRNTGFAAYSSGLTLNSAAPVRIGENQPADRERQEQARGVGERDRLAEAEDARIERGDAADKEREAEDVRGIDEGVDVLRAAQEGGDARRADRRQKGIHPGGYDGRSFG